MDFIYQNQGKYPKISSKFCSNGVVVITRRSHQVNKSPDEVPGSIPGSNMFTNSFFGPPVKLVNDTFSFFFLGVCG